MNLCDYNEITDKMAKIRVECMYYIQHIHCICICQKNLGAFESIISVKGLEKNKKVTLKQFFMNEFVNMSIMNKCLYSKLTTRCSKKNVSKV